MNKSKLLGVTICLVLIGVGILLMAGWDNQRATAAGPDA
jgi:hypothetical protein